LKKRWPVLNLPFPKGGIPPLWKRGARGDFPRGMRTAHVAYISVGSNIGDKFENCRRGVDALLSSPDVHLTARSRVYRTEPVDFSDQDWFINYVIRIGTPLDPLDLLERLQRVQREAGRVDSGVRFGPRVLDLDILLYDHLILADPRLSLPHPRMHQRRFVLKPLCDIDPTLVHPIIGKDVKTLLTELAEEGQQVVLIS
jgi:2-amino-4-hydroxy-6-hydroxymethyldihydropteridine diphosphokinase